MIAMGDLKPQGDSLMLPAERPMRVLIDQFKSFGADLIHCHTVAAASQAIPAGNRINVPCVFTSDGYEPVLAARRSGIKFATICLSRASFKDLTQGDDLHPDVYCVPNGTRTAPYERVAEMPPPYPPDLIFAGMLRRVKAADVAILAMAELRRRCGSGCPVLNIYGSGDQETHLKEIADVLDLNDLVRFHGLQPGILGRCPATDILIMTSRREVGPPRCIGGDEPWHANSRNGCRQRGRDAT